jgi:purine-binding chemotaxis protein CheW
VARRTLAGEESMTSDRSKGSFSIINSVNWDDVHRRLEAFQKALEKGWTLNKEEKRRILKTRAMALALEFEKEEPGERIEIVEFLLSSERYGLELRNVREVWPLKDLTPIPCTPPFVLGVINVRGQILSIIDLKKLLDLPEKGLGDLNKVLILKSDTMEFGILADDIIGVRSVPLRELKQSVPTLTGLGQEYLKGVSKERLIVLDAGQILLDKRIVVEEEVR